MSFFLIHQTGQFYSDRIYPEGVTRGSGFIYNVLDYYTNILFPQNYENIVFLSVSDEMMRQKWDPSVKTWL